MMIGKTLQKHLLAINEQTMLRIHLDGSHTKGFSYLVSHLSLVIVKRNLGSI